MNPFRWLRNSQNGDDRRAAAAHDLGQDERRPHDLADRRIPETTDLDLADPRGIAVERDRAFRAPGN